MWLNLYGWETVQRKHKKRQKCIFCVFRLFLPLCQTASQPYRLSYINVGLFHSRGWLSWGRVLWKYLFKILLNTFKYSFCTYLQFIQNFLHSQSQRNLILILKPMLVLKSLSSEHAIFLDLYNFSWSSHQHASKKGVVQHILWSELHSGTLLQGIICYFDDSNDWEMSRGL